MTKNSRAKRDARHLAAFTGMKYTEARRRAISAVVPGAGEKFAEEHRVAARVSALAGQEDPSATVQAVYGWVGWTLPDMSASDLARDVPFDLQDAEVDSAQIVSLGVERDLVEQYDDGLLLIAASFELDVVLRGLVPTGRAHELEDQGAGLMVESVGDDLVQIVLRPHRAHASLSVREEGEEAEVVEVSWFTWI